MTTPVRNGATPDRGETLPLVGRTAERDRLLAALSAVAAGRSALALIEGEAGIGKTRLVEELVADAHASDFLVLSGRADEFEQARLFGAIADAVAAGARAGDAVSASLVDRMRSAGGRAEQVVDLLLDALEELTTRAPVAVILEDLHWGDAATIGAVRSIGRRLAYLPLLVVVTYRPHPLPPELTRLIDAASREGATTMTLQPLDDASTLELARRTLEAEPGPGLLAALRSAAGNPLFVTELLRGLRDEGVIRVERGTAEGDPRWMPPSLRVTILRRLSFLPPETFDTLRAAAVLGSSFQTEELAAVLRSSGHRLLRALEPALRARVLGEDAGLLRFRHDVIREAIYEDVPAPLRASMHVDAAKALRSMSVSPTRLAEHLLRGPRSGGAELLEMIVETAGALRLSVPRVAVELYERAIEIVGGDDARADEFRVVLLWPLCVVGRGADAIALADRLLARPHDAATEARIRLARIEAAARTGAAAQHLPELERMADDPRYPAEMRRRARSALATAYVRSGQPGVGLAAATRVVEEARTAGDNDTLVWGLFNAGMAELFLGRPLVAIEHMREAMRSDARARSPIGHPHFSLGTMLLDVDRFDDARAELAEGRRREQQAGAVSGLAPLATLSAGIAFLEGAWDDAVAEARTATGLIEEGIGSAVAGMSSYAVIAHVALRRGARDEAREAISSAYAFLARSGPVLATEMVTWCDALIHEDAGDLVRAMEILWGGWQMTEPLRYAFTWRFVAPDVVRIALANEQRERARAVAEVADEGARRAGDVASATAVALRCRGLVDDDPDKLIAAVALYRQTPRAFERTLAAEDAAMSLARRGDVARARALFEDALTFWEGQDCVRDAGRIARAMRAAGMRPKQARRQRPATGWAALTPSEREIARLAAAGLTNPQIAERLFVSKYTVMTHLSHVFAKLGISSRVELAAIAARELDGVS